MNYYTSQIPITLAEKLKEKGMPMGVWQGWATPYISVIENSEVDWLDKELGNEPSKVERHYSVPSYAEVFDWLMSEKRLDIIIKPYWNTYSWESYVTKIPEIDMPKAGREIYVRSTWHEAANAAIERALELI